MMIGRRFYPPARILAARDQSSICSACLRAPQRVLLRQLRDGSARECAKKRVSTIAWRGRYHAGGARFPQRYRRSNKSDQHRGEPVLPPSVRTFDENTIRDRIVDLPDEADAAGESKVHVL